MTETIDHREGWTTNDDGTPVPRRTNGSTVDRRIGFTSSDFALVCARCGDEYGNEPNLPLGVVAAHFGKHHPEAGPSRVELEMLWLGQGPAPKGNA